MYIAFQSMSSDILNIGEGFKKSEDNMSMLVKTLMSCKRYFPVKVLVLIILSHGLLYLGGNITVIMCLELVISQVNYSHWLTVIPMI